MIRTIKRKKGEVYEISINTELQCSSQPFIHGFISQGYLKTSANSIIADSEDGTFQMNEMGINFTNEPTDKLRIGMQFFARDYGSIGNDNIIMDWAFADYRFYDTFGIRGGKIKSPVGLYQETRDIDMLRIPVFLPWGAYDENLRDSANSIQGVGIYGDINTERFGSFNYQILAGTNNVPDGGGTALYLGIGIYEVTDIQMGNIWNYGLLWSDPTGMIRISQTAWFSDIAAKGKMQGTIGNYDMPYVEIYKSSFEFTWNNFVFTYERFWFHSALGIITESGIPLFPYSTRHGLGAYGLFSYRVNDILSVSYSYNEYYDDEGDRNGDGDFYKLYNRGQKHKAWHKESIFSIRLDVNSNWICKLEYHYVDGAAKLLPALDDDSIYKHYWHMFIAKVSYNF